MDRENDSLRNGLPIFTSTFRSGQSCVAIEVFSTLPGEDKNLIVVVNPSERECEHGRGPCLFPRVALDPLTTPSSYIFTFSTDATVSFAPPPSLDEDNIGTLVITKAGTFLGVHSNADLRKVSTVYGGSPVAYVNVKTGEVVNHRAVDYRDATATKMWRIADGSDVLFQHS